MLPLVLVHGGGFTGSCWDLLLPHLDGPALAVDLPGRGAHPAPLDSVTLGDCAASVVADVDAAGFDELVIVGHSLAGCTLPGAIGLLGDRVRHAVFIAASVPPHGCSTFDTLDPEIRAMADSAPPAGEPAPLDVEIARVIFGNDLDEERFAWCVERMVPEAPGLVTEKVDLTPLGGPLPRTWIRALLDAIVDPDKQMRFVANLGDCDVIDLDAAHMCMISKPAELAAILNRIAAG